MQSILSILSPLVAYVVSCRNANAAGERLTQEAFLAGVVRHIDEARKLASANEGLMHQFEEAVVYSSFYIDYMVHESNFPFHHSWQDLGASRFNELAGDEKFFDIFSSYLESEAPEAVEHLRLMYRMIGSGFSGSLIRKSAQLEHLLNKCAIRIGLSKEQVCCANLFKIVENPEQAKRPLYPKRLGLLMVLLGLVTLFVALGINLYLFRSATDDMRTALRTIEYGVEQKAIINTQHSGFIDIQGTGDDEEEEEDTPEATTPPVQTAQSSPPSLEEPTAYDVDLDSTTL